MAEHLRPPGQANQVIVVQHASMGLQFTTRYQADEKGLVAGADQLDQVACMRNRISVHKIVPKPPIYLCPELMLSYHEGVNLYGSVGPPRSPGLCFKGSFNMDKLEKVGRYRKP